MARIRQGHPDATVQAIKNALDDYEVQFPHAKAELYRQNPASVRLRVVDPQFKGMSLSERHAQVWNFLAARIPDESLADVSLLLTMPPSELKMSLANQEFENPTPSDL